MIVLPFLPGNRSDLKATVESVFKRILFVALTCMIAPAIMFLSDQALAARGESRG